jgi:hypothetical protein
MKLIRLLAVPLGLLLICSFLSAYPIIHKFEFWGKGTELNKMDIYVGWSNGFLMARGPRGLELADCLTGMSIDQAIAMIDKRYKDHPELWSHPLGEQILGAVTADGGPCDGKDPLR